MIYFDLPFNEIPADCLPAPGEVFAYRGPRLRSDDDCGELQSIAVAWFSELAALGHGLNILGYVFTRASAERLASGF